MNLLENKTLLIVGLGLIGGSIARGLSAAVPGIRILAHGRDELAMQSALLDGSIHAFSTDISVLAPQADVVMLCTPTLTVRSMFEQLREMIGTDVIVTDAASVKGNIVADARRLFADSLHRIVPGHPIAGSEQSGYKASKADLFKSRKVILTPLEESSTLAVRTVMQLWQLLGADVHAMTAERHDQVLAGTSHLPHLLAFTLVNTLVDSVSEQDRAQQVFDYAAGGFADFSRIASSDPRMWRDIFLANRDATVDVLDAYIGSLEQMRQRLIRGDGDALQSEFSRAKQMRDEFIRRFRPGAAHGELTDQSQTQSSGFTVEPASITVSSGSILRLTYRPAASLETALFCLEHCAGKTGLSRIQGFPESIEAINAVQHYRESGVPIVGPEQGELWVYGKSSANMQSISNPDIVLAADPVISGLLMLGAALVPGSSIQLSSAVDPSSDNSWLTSLAAFGINYEVLPNDAGPDNLSVQSPASSLAVARTSPLHGAELDLRESGLSDEQLLIVLAAAALASGPSTLSLQPEQATRVLSSFGALASACFDHTLDRSVGTLEIRPCTLVPTEMSLESKPLLSLLAIVIGQKLKGQLIIRQPGDLAACYPGLIATMAEAGYGLNVSTEYL